MQAVTNISASFSFVLLQIRLTQEVMTQWTGTSELTNADKANAQEPTRQTTLKWRQLTRPVSPAQYRLLPSAAEYSWHNLTHCSKSHSANEQCWKKQNWFVDPPNPLLCSILPPYTVGHKPSRNWECSTVCFFCFPQIGPLCSHKSTNSSYPNSLLVWPVSCVSVSWSKRQGERDGEENQTRYHSDVSYHSSRHRLFFSLPLLDFQCTPCDGCAASSIVTAAYQTVTQQEVLSHRELACFSTGNYSENLKSKLLCPQSQLLVYKNYYFLTGSVPHLQDESMAESNNYILFS